MRGSTPHSRVIGGQVQGKRRLLAAQHGRSTHWLKVLWGAGKMTREEIEGVGFEFCDCAEMMKVELCFSVCFALLFHDALRQDMTHLSYMVIFVMQRYDKDVLVDGMNTMPGKGRSKPTACTVMSTIMLLAVLEMMTVTMRMLSMKPSRSLLQTESACSSCPTPPSACGPPELALAQTRLVTGNHRLRPPLILQRKAAAITATKQAAGRTIQGKCS